MLIKKSKEIIIKLNSKYENINIFLIKNFFCEEKETALRFY